MPKSEFKTYVSGFYIGMAMLMAGVSYGPPAHARTSQIENAVIQPGTILIRLSERKLYFLDPLEGLIHYPVAVGMKGKSWQGMARIDSKRVAPAWSPPAEVKRDKPELPDVIPGGSPHNPMGLRALTLDRGQYAIHGTNRPESIGKAASYGCIRMHNRDIVDLFERVEVGTQVVVVP